MWERMHGLGFEEMLEEAERMAKGMRLGWKSILSKLRLQRSL